MSLFWIRLQQPQKLVIPFWDNRQSGGVVVTPLQQARSTAVIDSRSDSCEDDSHAVAQGIYTWHVADETPSRNHKSSSGRLCIQHQSSHTQERFAAHPKP